MRLVWTTTALERLDEIAQQIAADDPNRARSFVEGLATFPEMGRVVPELGKPHIRELLFASYRIVYGIRGRQISIRTIRHVRQSR
jgi:toxin ParE1/3/4